MSGTPPHNTDTIAAIATPPGFGGVAMVRISGPLAKETLSRMFLPLSPRFENFRPWFLHRGRVLDWRGERSMLAIEMKPRRLTRMSKHLFRLSSTLLMKPGKVCRFAWSLVSRYR